MKTPKGDMDGWSGPVWLLAGPTASGKTGAALQLARQHRLVIVNADSMQVYQDLSIITARPQEEELDSAPHRLFGFLDAATRYSTGAWLRDALKEIQSAWACGATPLLVGGTGLYFQALTRGLAHIPEVPAPVRNAVRQLRETRGLPALMEEAFRLDPVAASALQGEDTQRAERIVSVARATGIPLSQWQKETTPPLAGASLTTCMLEPLRETLYARINARCDAMVSSDAIAEVERLLERQLPSDLPAMRAIGVKEIAAILAGNTSIEQARDAMAQATRRYAKRQMTFARNQLAEWPRAATVEDVIARFTENP